jgi:hypothetical protein
MIDIPAPVPIVAIAGTGPTRTFIVSGPSVVGYFVDPVKVKISCDILCFKLGERLKPLSAVSFPGRRFDSFAIRECYKAYVSGVPRNSR